MGQTQWRSCADPSWRKSLICKSFWLISSLSRRFTGWGKRPRLPPHWRGDDQGSLSRAAFSRLRAFPRLGFRQRKIKGRAFVLFTFRPGVTAVAMDDAANVGQPNASALKVRRAVQALKNAKEFVGVTHVEPYTVVAHKNDVLGCRGAAADFNLCRFARASVFEGIGN